MDFCAEERSHKSRGGTGLQGTTTTCYMKPKLARHRTDCSTCCLDVNLAVFHPSGTQGCAVLGDISLVNGESTGRGVVSMIWLSRSSFGLGSKHVKLAAKRCEKSTYLLVIVNLTTMNKEAHKNDEEKHATGTNGTQDKLHVFTWLARKTSRDLWDDDDNDDDGNDDNVPVQDGSADGADLRDFLKNYLWNL
ncbi:uncharacterized protein LOC110046569 [Orbicella faveolata]|uniref:uncharacterized protein LOC110046569 n=1 Tax=Orbicella faveolata TaxID=48498 RepID=UPI0009E578FF|nr:uncharacterized protein LOC110046569 [Orbicella faveolata]